MNRSIPVIFTLLLMFALLFASPTIALANEGGEGAQEAEVGGYHIAISSENDWETGANAIVVTIADEMGMPLEGAEVEILLAPKSDEHAESETEEHGGDSMPGDEHAESETDEHGGDSMPGMDMDEADMVATPPPGEMAPVGEMSPHGEEEAGLLSMTDSGERGIYRVETVLETSGEYDAHVMFHVNGEMLQADFVVKVARPGSQAFVLWGFVAVNAVIVASAGVMKKQSIQAKGGK